MLSFIKNLFRDTRSAEVVSKSSSSDLVSELPETPPAPTPAPFAAPVTQSQSSTAEGTLQLPLKPVLDKIPRPLLSHVLRAPTAADKLNLPLATALSQLPTGSVKVPFRDIQHALPQIFGATAEGGDTLIELPLGEILPRIQPTHLARRREQKTVVVPAEFTPVFRSHSDAPSTGMAAGRVMTAPVAASVAAPVARAAAQHPVAFPKPPSAKPAVPSPKEALAPTQPSPAVLAALKAAAPQPAVRVPAHGGPDRPINGAALKPAAAPSGSGEREPIKVPLTVVARNWPDPLRSEIVAAHFAASLLIPYADLEAALKRGRAIFSWKLIRSWLTPKGTAALSEYDDLTLELPLSVLAPMFVGRWSSNRSVNQITPQELPDVFLPRKKEEAPATAAAPAPTSAPTAPAVSTPSRPVSEAISPAPISAAAAALPTKNSAPVVGAPVVSPKPVLPSAATLAPETPIKLSSIAAATLTPSAQAVTAPQPAPAAKKSLAPKDAVDRACGLHGVAGALVATHDGLIVATHLPASVNGEALGAFLPQIFGRLAQYTRELKFDSPTQLQMLLGKTPLYLTKTPIAFFGVLGKPAEVLPQAELGALADQLSSATN